MKYRKNPIVVEAKQYLNDAESYNILHWVNEGQHKNKKEHAAWINGVMIIPTLEGDHTANVGDWIIEGVNGEFYPCKPDIFKKTYEPA